MTTVPEIDTLSKACRMASTAAPSAAFLLPRPGPLRGRDGRGLGDAYEFECEVAVGMLRGFGGPWVSSSSCPWGGVADSLAQPRAIRNKGRSIRPIADQR